MNNQELKTGEVVLYTNPDGSTAVDVRLEQETVWLSQAQMAELFDKSRATINEHIKNIYKEGELEENGTISKFGNSEFPSDKPTNFYNLDVIISVGYRVKSKRGVQFRIWANQILKEYLIKGYAINHTRLSDEQIQQFHQALSLFPQTVERLSNRDELTSDESVALMQLVAKYASSWALLQQYDDGELEQVKQGKAPTFELTYEGARMAVDELKKDLMSKGEASELFGNERDESFKGVLGNIYQTFGGKELYPTIEHKAAHLLYFIIKDHPFSDGNKRSAALLFIYFLSQNNYLNRATGSSKVDENTLVALTLFIAESDPKQKEIMVALVMHLLQG